MDTSGSMLYQAPPPTPRGRGLLIALGFFVLLAIGLWAFVWFYPPARTSVLLWAAHTTLAPELRGASFVAQGGTVQYPGLASVERLGGSLVSETENTSGSAQIVEGKESTFTVLVNGEPVLSDSHPRIGVALSPSGDRVAFAEWVEGEGFVSPTQAPILSTDRKSWKVVVYDASTRTAFTLGEGASPVFFDDTHIAWLAPAGVALADLTTGSTTLLMEELKMHVPLSTLRSPDGRVVGWFTPDNRSVALFRFSENTVAPVATMSLPSAVMSVSLGNDALYAIRLDRWKTRIIKQPFTGGAVQEVMALPSALHIQRVSTGSI